MIAGLLQNSNTNNIEKAPFLGDVPVLGALFRSTKFQRNETELVIIVTPYLVRPVSGQLATPTDGYRAPDDVQRNFLGQSYTGKSGSVQPTAIQARPLARRRRGQRLPLPGIQAVNRRLTGKDWTMRSKVILIALASSVAACNTPDLPDKGVAAVNVPVVTSADYVFDAAAPDGALAPGEPDRLERLVPGPRPRLRRLDLRRRRLMPTRLAARSPRLPASTA